MTHVNEKLLFHLQSCRECSKALLDVSYYALTQARKTGSLPIWLRYYLAAELRELANKYDPFEGDLRG